MKNKTPAKKAAKKKPVKVDKNAGIVKDVTAFLQERIADGGATTDHLQGMLNKIVPPVETPAPEEASINVTYQH